MDEGIEIFAYKWIFAKVISLWSGRAMRAPTMIEIMISFIRIRVARIKFLAKTKIGKNLQKFSKNSLQMEKGVL